MNAPTLLTARLRLQAPCKADFEAYLAMWQDDEVVRFLGGQTRPHQDAWLTFIRQAGLWPVLGYGYWTVRTRREGEYVGEIGFADYGRGMVPDISGFPEAGWVLARAHWGQGYASEALGAIHNWLDHTRPGRSICIIEPDHAASIRIAQKLAYSQFADSVYRGTPMRIFERMTSGA